MISVLCGAVVDTEHARPPKDSCSNDSMFQIRKVLFFKSLFFSQSTLCITWLMLALGPQLSLDCISSVMGFTAVVVQFVFKIFRCAFYFLSLSLAQCVAGELYSSCLGANEA